MARERNPDIRGALGALAKIYARLWQMPPGSERDRLLSSIVSGNPSFPYTEGKESDAEDDNLVMPVSTKEGIENLTNVVTAGLPEGRVSRDSLGEFIAHLGSNPLVQGVIFLDAPQSNARPELQIHTLWRRPFQQEDLPAMEEITRLHSDFVLASLNTSTNPYHSRLEIVDPSQIQTTGALAASIRDLYEGSSARVLASAEFPPQAS